MGLTIHRAKIRFISGRNGTKHLKAHLSYVARKSALIFSYNAMAQTYNELFIHAQERLSKRRDARIGLSIYLALPYMWYVVGKGKPEFLEAKAKEITTFLAKTLQMREQDLMLFFHKPNEDGKNFHVHVVGIPRRADGKPLKLSPSEIYAFHESLDTFLAEQGFETFRCRDYPELGLSEKTTKELLLPHGAYKSQQATAIKELRREVRMHAEQEINIRTKLTRRHLNTLYAPEDRVWILLRKPNETKAVIRKVKVKNINDDFLSWLRHMNAKGYNVYISLNTFREDSKERKEEQIEPMQDKIWLDLDSEKLKTDANKVLDKILEETGLPRPTLIIRTSQTQYGDNLQVVWKFKEKVSFEKLKEVMKELENRYGLDKTHDGARVFRLAGFNNKKEGKTGKDLCYVVKTNDTYDLKVLETLRARLTHAEAGSSLPEKEEKEEKQPQPQSTQKTQPQTPTQPTIQPKPAPTTRTQGSQTPTQTKPATQLQSQHIPSQQKDQKPDTQPHTPHIPKQQKPQKPHRERIKDFFMTALKDYNIKIDLSNIGPDKSPSEVEYAVCRETLIPLLQRMSDQEAIKTVEKTLQDFLSQDEERKAKLERSKDYPSRTATKAYDSIQKILSQHATDCINILRQLDYDIRPPEPPFKDTKSIHIHIVKELLDMASTITAYDLLLEVLTKTFKKPEDQIKRYADQVFKEAISIRLAEERAMEQTTSEEEQEQQEYQDTQDHQKRNTGFRRRR